MQEGGGRSPPRQPFEHVLARLFEGARSEEAGHIINHSLLSWYQVLPGAPEKLVSLLDNKQPGREKEQRVDAGMYHVFVEDSRQRHHLLPLHNGTRTVSAFCILLGILSTTS